MKVEDLKLEQWFKDLLAKVMEHNDYPNDCLDYKTCNTINSWTPADLIVREYLNNGGGSAQGFLGITTEECQKCYDYIVENKEYFIYNDLVNERATNNSGWELWFNWNF